MAILQTIGHNLSSWVLQPVGLPFFILNFNNMGITFWVIVISFGLALAHIEKLQTKVLQRLDDLEGELKQEIKENGVNRRQYVSDDLDFHP